MQFGVCGNFELNSIAADAGYDYTEWSVPNLLCPLEPDTAFDESLSKIRDAKLPYSASNGFVPGELKITGPEVDFPALEKYVSTAMQRAKKAAIAPIVF